MPTKKLVETAVEGALAIGFLKAAQPHLEPMPRERKKNRIGFPL